MHDDRVDDTVDVVHGHQQLSLFNAHYYRRCFMPIHVYDAATCRPVAMVLRLGKTPTGEEIRGYLRRLVRRIRARWPTTRILIRGDGHYGRAHVMARCENNGVDYPFGQPGNKVLQRLVDESADDIRTRRALERKSVLRGYAETATRRNPGRRNVAPALASRQPRWPRHPLRRHQSRQRLRRAHLRRDLLRPRPGRNLIKMHKSQLASDRTSCRPPIANQVRLVLHTAAYWLMLTLREGGAHDASSAQRRVGYAAAQAAQARRSTAHQGPTYGRTGPAA
nr:transposase [Mesorhizobium sp. LCM 4577]